MKAEGQKCSKTLFKLLEKQNMQSQTIFKLHTENNKSKDILKHSKSFHEKLYTIETSFKAANAEFLSKTPNRKKISNEKFYHFKVKTYLYEIIKSQNSQTNNKSLGNDALTAGLYKQFSNKLAPFLLDVYDS